MWSGKASFDKPVLCRQSQFCLIFQAKLALTKAKPALPEIPLCLRHIHDIVKYFKEPIKTNTSYIIFYGPLNRRSDVTPGGACQLPFPCNAPVVT